MTRTAVSSDQAPDALGPYSQAIVAGGLVFCSGMAGIDPATGAIADGIEAQTEQALVNLAAVLSAARASMEDVVKTTIFYANVEDFGRLNEVYARHMPDPPPARSAPAHVRLLLDEEVRRLIDEAHAEVAHLLSDHRDELDNLAHALLPAETLDALNAYAAAGIPMRRTDVRDLTGAGY